MIQERPAIKMGSACIMPLDWFLWASDFPHSVGTFPQSPKYIESAFAGVDPQMVRKITVENAANYYGLDLNADISETPMQLAS